MRARIRRGPCAAGAGVACLFLLAGTATGQTSTTYYQYLGDYPKNRNSGWHVEVQGLAHDDDHWFVTQKDRLWRIPVSFDLNADVYEPAPAPPGRPVAGILRRELADYPRLGAYNHLGDPDYLPRAAGGYLVVPLEGDGDIKAVGIFDPTSLDYVSHVPVPDQYQDSCGWLALDPDGRLYTSGGDPTRLNRFTVDWDSLPSTAPSLAFDKGGVPILDATGRGFQLHHMQGGEFTEDGRLLYIVTGFYKDTDPVAAGVHVFDTKTWRRVGHSTNGYGPFNYEFHPGGNTDEEPEGLTIWDLDDGRAPGVGGQLHVLMLDNDDWPSSDDVYLKHYSRWIYVDGRHAGAETGSRSEPWRSIASAVETAWPGAQISIRGGAYPERLTLDKELLLDAEAGEVLIGAL